MCSFKQPIRWPGIQLAIVSILLYIPVKVTAQFQYLDKFPVNQPGKQSDVAGAVTDVTHGYYFVLDSTGNTLLRYNLKKTEILPDGKVKVGAITPDLIPLPFPINVLNTGQEKSYGVSYDELNSGTLYFADSQRITGIYNAIDIVPQVQSRAFNSIPAWRLPSPRAPRELSSALKAAGTVKVWERGDNTNFRGTVNFVASDARDLFIGFSNGDLVRFDSNTLLPFDQNPLHDQNQSVMEHPFFEPAYFTLCDGITTASTPVINSISELFPELPTNPYFFGSNNGSPQPEQYWQFPFEFLSAAVDNAHKVLLVGDNTSRVFKIRYYPDHWAVQGLTETVTTDTCQIKVNIGAYPKLASDVRQVRAAVIDDNGYGYFALASLQDAQAFADIVKSQVGDSDDVVTPVNSVALNDVTILDNFLNDVHELTIDRKLGYVFAAGGKRDSFASINDEDSQVARVARLKTNTSSDMTLDKMVNLNNGTTDLSGLQAHATSFYRDNDGREMLFVGVQNTPDSIVVMRPYDPASQDLLGAFTLPGSVGFGLVEQKVSINENEIIFVNSFGRLKSRLAIWDDLNRLRPFGTVPVDFYLASRIGSVADIEDSGIFVGRANAKVGFRTFSRINGPNFDARLVNGDSAPFPYFVAVIDPANTQRETNETNNIVAAKIHYLPVGGKIK